MNQHLLIKFFNVKRYRISLLTIIFIVCGFAAIAQPANDNCNSAQEIVIGNAGFQTGLFTSDTIDISAATMQSGETVPTSLFVAGQHQKSIWFKFTISTTRKLKVTLNQPGIAITNGNVGFSVYRTYNCLPTTAQISTKLTPLEVFGSSFHPCVDSGTYYVQVSSKPNANGPVFITLEVGTSDADYDERVNAYQFGLMNTSAKHVVYEINCHSIENLSETCLGSTLPNASSYTKTSWHTFTTPAYFDYISMMVAAGNTPYFTNLATQHIIGYKLYEGDATVTQISGLTLVDGCDTLRTNGNKPSYRTYKCGMLDPNKTYSLQLFFKTDFEASIRVGLIKEGIAPTKGPVPSLAQMHPDNIIGNLPFGVTTRTDYFACNSRHNVNNCGNTKLPQGLNRPGVNYNLSTYFTYNLPQAGNVEISVVNSPGVPMCRNVLVRIFKSSLTNNCTSLDTSSLFAEFTTQIQVGNLSRLYNCMPEGTYVVQVLGTDTILNNLLYTFPTTSAASLCLYNNFGQPFDLKITHTQVHPRNNFSLYQSGAFNNINNGTPLAINNTYFSTVDTFGCFNAPLPGAGNCAATFRKAMYRQFTVTDSMALVIDNLSAPFNTNFNNIQTTHYYRYQFFKGDANALATAQNTWINPDTFTGLTRYTNCFFNSSMPRFCLEPGTYTFVTQGDDNFINRTDQPSFTTANFTTLHYSPATTGNMGDIVSIINNPLGGTVTSTVDRFSCLNNAVTIDGLAPCFNATKAIYREFYLSQVSTIGITTSHARGMAVFSGRLSTVGFTGLTNVSGCTGGVWGNQCTVLQPGWYTVVSYGNGASYEAPFLNDVGSNVLGLTNTVTITLLPPCPQPLFNRPHKAATTVGSTTPILLQWNAAVMNDAYPVTGVTYNLPADNLNCVADTPFSSHPINSCNNNLLYNRISYYVIQLTQESYLNIGSNNASSMIALYKADVRVDSMLFPSLSPILPCATANGQRIEICKLQPGIYTLILYHPLSICTSIAPIIYIDHPGTSRFDHASNAYDFGIVPDNNIYQNGKVGDVNPLHPGRAPSNDFFYCTTGAQASDPTQGMCAVNINPVIYSVPDSNVIQWPNGPVYSSRRNLWYTFQVNKPGWIKIKVDAKTTGLNNQSQFVVYRSDVNGALPFSQVVSQGEVDSTFAQGLTHISNNGTYAPITCQGRNTDSFFIAPCTFDSTQRYYIIVDNRSHSQNPLIMRPNHQVEVSIAVNPVPQVNTQFDYYQTADNMGILGVGNHSGTLDNYTCATANTSYPIAMPFCAQKTLWYRFSVGSGVYGTAKIRLLINGTNQAFGADDFYLLKETIVNDSTASGLKKVVLSTIPGYRQGCVEENTTYYLVLTGCNRTTETVVPQIWIEQNVGDYCSDPLIANITGPGAFSATALVDCHTIGTDYGELSTLLSCPPNALTELYKSTWFRIDVSGVDTLDLTLALQENTTASPSQIQYRMMTGNCAAMQEQSCVFNAQTQNTYQCLIPGLSYFIQVLSPKSYFNNDPEFPTLGTITLQANAVQHVDTCSPINNCLINANYIHTFDCNVNDSVLFNNFSTFGTAVDYLWDFGYNNQTSTAFEPRFRYPALTTTASYTVILRAINTSCNDTAFSIQTITIPPRPEVNLGNDTATCDPNAIITLNATSHTGSTYLWHDNSTLPTYNASSPDENIYYVAVTYAGCTVRDTVSIFISPLSPNPIDTLLFCDNFTGVILDATRSFAGTTYSWYNSQTTPDIIVPAVGTYWADVSYHGCTVRDSFVVIYNPDTLFVLGNDTAICNFVNGFTLNATISGAFSYLWQDFTTAPQYTINSPGNYWVMITFNNGCAYTDSINISSLPLPQSIQYDTVCYGTVYTLPWNTTVTASGIYTDTIAVAGSCDSVITVNLNILDSIVATAFDTVCLYNLPYVWNGISVTSGGPNAATYSSTASNGCDSVTHLNLFVKTTDSTHINQQVCVYILPYNFYGSNLNANGTYYHTLSGSSGCDSIIVLHLQVVTEYRDTFTANICGNDSYTYNNVTYTTPGFYQHSFPNNSGCDSFMVLHLTQSPIPPAPQVVSPIGYCLNANAIPLTATGNNLLWFTGPVGGVGSTVAPTPTTTVVGQQAYYVSQTVNGCESPRSEIIVEINNKATANFEIIPNEMLCKYETAIVAFTGNQLGGNQVWQWDNATVTGAEPGPYTAYWNTPGTKTVKLWIDNTGCISDTVTKQVIIKDGPDMPELDIPDFVCVNQTILLKGISNFNGAVNYMWTYDGTPIQQGADFTMVWESPGKHYFTLQLEFEGCKTPPIKDSIEVIALPIAQIDVMGSTYCHEDTITVSANTDNANVSYTWSPEHYFRDGLSNQGSSVKVFVSGPGYLVLEVKNNYGCRNFDSIQIQTKQCCDIFVPNAFSPNGDGRNDEFLLQTITRQDLEEFAIYNRYGQRVFITDNMEKGWDGRHKGKDCDVAVYFYYIKFTCKDGTKMNKKGEVHLVR